MKINKRIIFEVCFGLFNAACTVGAVSTMHKASLKANDILKSEEFEKYAKAVQEADDKSDLDNALACNLTTKDKIKATWKVYMLPVTLCACSVTMTLVSSYCHITTLKQQLALLGVIGAGADRYKKLSAKVKESYGEESYNHMIEELEAEQSQPPYISYGGYCDSLTNDVSEPNCLFYDAYSNTWFMAPRVRVLNAAYHANRNMAITGGIYLHQFYEFLGLTDSYNKYKPLDLSWQPCDSYYFIDIRWNKRHKPDGTPYIEQTFDMDPMPETYWEEYGY